MFTRAHVHFVYTKSVSICVCLRMSMDICMYSPCAVCSCGIAVYNVFVYQRLVRDIVYDVVDCVSMYRCRILSKCVSALILYTYHIPKKHSLKRRKIKCLARYIYTSHLRTACQIKLSIFGFSCVTATGTLRSRSTCLLNKFSRSLSLLSYYTIRTHNTFVRPHFYIEWVFFYFRKCTRPLR